jgi:hypothetical protein
MPYIKEDRRVELAKYITALDDKLHQMGDVGGDMNYVICTLLFRKFKRVRKYVTIEQMMGTLTCVALEFYRRCAAPYEDGAMRRNKDMFV